LRYINALPRFLLKLPSTVRFIIVMVTLLFFLFLYVMIAPPARNPSILVIPMALAAWMFKRRGVFFCLLSIVIPLWLYYSIVYNSLLLRPMVDLSFVFGSFALLAIGFLISSQRDSLDLADAARQQLATVYQQQQQLNQLKDQFILNVNHELRTPLTAVYGYLELLLQHHEHIDAETHEIFLRNAMYSCEELQLLVNNVLDAMQISTETTALTLEELVVADVVHDVLRHIDPRWLQEHHLVLNISPDIVVLAHAQYLRQILRNLLSNSFKYAPVGTPVEITAERYGDTALVARPSSEVCISVKDYGPGIPPAEIPRLFVQFGRLKRDLSGKIRGTGLGLYVSKQLVEAMNGRIWAESSGIEGEGSRFCFTLPCAPRSKIQADEAASPLSDQPSLI